MSKNYHKAVVKALVAAGYEVSSKPTKHGIRCTRPGCDDIIVAQHIYTEKVMRLIERQARRQL